MFLLIFLFSICQPIQLEINKPQTLCQQQHASEKDRLLISIHSTNHLDLSTIRLALFMNNTEVKDQKVQRSQQSISINYDVHYHAVYKLCLISKDSADRTIQLQFDVFRHGTDFKQKWDKQLVDDKSVHQNQMDLEKIEYKFIKVKQSMQNKVDVHGTIEKQIREMQGHVNRMQLAKVVVVVSIVIIQIVFYDFILKQNIFVV